MSDATTFDLLIVGGGINGVGIARDAAGRGLKVLLIERDTLAAHTSSASSKLIHGGLRYLEQGAVISRDQDQLDGIADEVSNFEVSSFGLVGTEKS